MLLFGLVVGLATGAPGPLTTRSLALLQEHSGRVFRLQFDDFQIVSSSHDDTILIWDFLHLPSEAASSPLPPRTYTYVNK